VKTVSYSPLRVLVLGAAALSLSGCVTLFPKQVPAQLYRFGIAAPAEAPAKAEPQISVARANTTFTHGAESDQILTSTGDQVAYVAGARWVAPAVSLFDEAESAAFDQSAIHVRLARRGEMVQAPVGLRLDVETFEARYENGASAAPTVVVRIRAILTHIGDRKVLAAHTFEVSKPAEANRVGAIVTGFDAALTDCLGQVVTWTDAQATG